MTERGGKRMKRNLYKRMLAVCSTMAFIGTLTPDMCLTEALLPAAVKGIVLEEFAQQVSALAAQDDYASYYDKLEITAGESAVLADGAEITLDKAAEWIDGEIYVPAQFLIDLSGTDTLEESGMVPLRQTAESLGFVVTETDHGAVLENQFQTARLIVKSDQSIDSFGAKETIEGFENLHIFQYETPAEAFSAYQNYLLMDAVEDVAPSEYVSVAENTIGVSDVHYTWGADVMQTDTYCDFLLEQSESLPEVVVAVIDTGIDFEHEWFEGRLAGNGVNFVDTGSALPQDDHSHGTHVSGTICDLTPDNVKILPLKALDATGQATTEQVYCAMLYANANAVDVVNMSLGGGGYTFLYEDAINAGTEAGIVYCISAGNDASDCSLYGPANIKSAITVSAVEQNGDPAYFTNYGAGIDFAAPGVSIISAKLGGGTVALDGTSMASPHAAACCALLKSYDRSLNTEQIVDILSLHADDLGEPGFDPYYGNGRISMDFTGANTAMCAQPQFAPRGGVYDAAQTVTITADADCAIYYTTDNTVPTAENGTLYTGPITVSSSVILRATAVCAGKETNTASAHYQIGGADVADALVVSDGVLVAYNGIQTELDLTAYSETAEITAIGNSVFENNKQLEKIILPETVTQIGDRAFFGCSNLDFSAVDFSKLETIGTAAFSECTALSGEIRLGSLRSLGASAFSFTGISAVYLSENITTVPERCFYDCRAVRGIYADGVTVLEDYALAFNTDEPITFGIDWTKVTKIGAYAVCEQDFSAPVCLDAIETLSPHSFSVCSFDTLRISGMKELAEGAFYACTASFIYLDDVQNIALEHLPTAGYLILSDTCTSVTCAKYYQNDATIIGYGGSEVHRLALESDRTFLELPCGVLADDETVSVYQYDHTTLSVLAIGFDLTYQWYVSESPEDAGTAVAGATQAEFTVPTDTAGTFYYRCEMTCRGYAPSFTNGTYMVVVQPCEQISLTEGEPFVLEDETYAVFSFTPSADGTYEFLTASSSETTLLVCDENGALDLNDGCAVLSADTEYRIKLYVGSPVSYTKLLVQNVDACAEYSLSRDITVAGPDTEYLLATGEAIVPEVVLRHGDKILTEGVDYTVMEYRNIKPGTGRLFFTGIGAYDGFAVYSFRIAGVLEYDTPTTVEYVGDPVLYLFSSETLTNYRFAANHTPGIDYNTVSHEGRITATNAAGQKVAYAYPPSYMTILELKAGETFLLTCSSDAPVAYYDLRACAEEAISINWAKLSFVDTEDGGYTVSMTYKDEPLVEGVDYYLVIQKGELYDTVNINGIGKYFGVRDKYYYHATESDDDSDTESGQTALEFDGTLTAEEPITLDFSSDYMLTYSITPLTEAPYRFITGEDVWVAKLYKRSLGNTDDAWIETDINEPDALQQLNAKYEYAVSFFCTDKGTHDVNLIRTLKLPEAEITVQDYLYTGQEIIPEFTISFPDAELTEGVDYVVEYDCGTEPGLYSVLARGINRYNGTRAAYYKIVRAVEESVPVLEQGAHTLTFTEPGEVKVYRFDSLQKLYLLRAAADFGVKIAFTDANGETIADTLSGCANMEWEVALTNASAYYFHISLTDPSATGTVEFSVTDKYRRLEFVKVNRPVLPYSGELQTPEFILTDGDYTLVEGTDYYIHSISGNTNGGEYSAPIVGMGQYYGVLYGEYIITPPMDLDLTQAVEWESLKQTILLDLKDRTDLLVHFTVEESGHYFFSAKFSSVAGADLSVIPAMPSFLLFDSAFHFYSFDLVEYLPTGDYYLLLIDIASDFYDELEMRTKNLGDQLETSGGLLYETDGGSATIIGHTDTDVEMIALPFSVDGMPTPILNIADYAFAGYENLRSVDLREIWKGPKKYIGRGAFLGTALESITLDRDWYLDQYSVGYDADYNPIEGFTIYGYRGTDAQRYAEENGFIFVDMESKGDLNGDTLVDAGDATIILKAYAQALNNGQAVPEGLTTTGDVDSNGKLDADDAVAILKVYANYILTGEIDWSVVMNGS